VELDEGQLRQARGELVEQVAGDQFEGGPEVEQVGPDLGRQPGARPVELLGGRVGVEEPASFGQLGVSSTPTPDSMRG
jgi:hypothetical protein